MTNLSQNHYNFHKPKVPIQPKFTYVHSRKITYLPLTQSFYFQEVKHTMKAYSKTFFKQFLGHQIIETTGTDLHLAFL